jgi:hypothetical protein
MEEAAVRHALGMRGGQLMRNVMHAAQAGRREGTAGTAARCGRSRTAR